MAYDAESLKLIKKTKTKIYMIFCLRSNCNQLFSFKKNAKNSKAAAARKK